MSVSPDEVLRVSRALIGSRFNAGGYDFLSLIARRLNLIDDKLLKTYADDDGSFMYSLRNCVIARRVSTEVPIDQVQVGDVATFLVHLGVRLNKTGEPMPSEWPVVVSCVDPRTYIYHPLKGSVVEEQLDLPLCRAFRFGNENPDLDERSIDRETYELGMQKYQWATWHEMLTSINSIVGELNVGGYRDHPELAEVWDD